MPRETSRRAYESIKASGLINRMHMAIFETLYKFDPAPLTRSEVLRAMHSNGGANGLGSRMTELVRMGVVRECPPQECRITGRKVLAYQITGNLPSAPRRVVSRKQLEAALKIATDRLAETGQRATLRKIKETLNK